MYRDAPESHNGLLSEAESRVTDWINAQQQQKSVRKPEALVSLAPEEIIDKLEVDRLRLKLGQLLLEGTFGRIYQVGCALNRQLKAFTMR